MSPTGFSTAASKKIWIGLLLSLFFSGLIVSALFLLSPEQYETSTSLYLSAGSLDLSADRSIAENYAEIVESELFASMVIKRLGLGGITQTELSNGIRAGVVNSSNVLEIKVRHKNKDTAKKIAEALPAVINDFPLPVSGTVAVIVLNMPADAKPLTSQTFIMVIISFVTGNLLAAGFLLAVKMKNRLIRTPQDVENSLGLKVAGIIPDYDI